MAHTKTGATVKGSRNSIAKRLGIKKYEGESVIPGNIILRQRGTKVHPGTGVLIGKDHTIMAISQGLVSFSKRYGKTIVNVSK